MAMSIIQNDFQRLTTPYESDLYHQFPLGRPATATTTSSSHTRHSSSSTSYSLPSSNLTSPGDSPPNLPNNQQLKPHHMSTHIRRAREATSPYIRDHHTHSGSESGIDNDELNMFSYHQPDYPHPAAAMYSQAIDQNQAHPQQHPQQHPPHPVAHPPGVFGRTTLGPDHALEQLAASVRSATTTSASDRAKQIFVQAWLNANYAPYADGNVPRQGLYFSYRRVCDQYHIPHINTATLGKAIRLCFPNIKTRRLGVRGNSKYHYCGIRPATSAEAEWLQDYIRKSNNLAHQNGVHIRGATAQPSAGNTAAGSASARDGARTSEDDEDDDGSSEEASSAPNKRASLNLDSSGRFPMDTTADRTPTSSSLLSAAQQARPSTSNGTSYTTPAPIRRRSTAPPGQQVGSQPPPQPTAAGPAPAAAASTPNLAPNEPVAAGPFITHASLSVRNLPYFPSIEEALGPATTGSSGPSSAAAASPHGTVAREVWRWFEDHLDALLESVRSFRFDQFEIHLRTFWAGLSGDHREVVHAPAVAGLMAKADAIVYDEILETLRSQILVPIPAHSLTSLRQLADKMEKILLLALESYGSTFVEPKVELGARFGHLVLRFLDIFQVTQALSTVLQNPKQLQDMRRSWSEIDFDSVRNQSALVCNCRHEDLAQLLEVDFVALLDNLARSPEPVREVMVWADDCCERLMGAGRHGHAGQEDKTTMSSRSVLIRWGYVTSQIMRDLTIRSDPAFGAFQILKLFLDDWIALNVLRSVALSTNSVAASVEPVMQQHFFTLSPMPGQEFAGGAGGLDASRAAAGAGAHQAAHAHPGALANMHSNPMLNHTPTTSSMLAALNDPFPGPLNSGAAGATGAPTGPNPGAPGGAPATGSGAFGLGANDGSAYSTQMGSFMDTSGQPPNESYSSLSFGDFGPSGPTGFDVNFTQELMATRGDGVDGGVIDASVKDEVVG